MNLEEARNVLWLKSNPRPLGELFDEGYLTRERLEWAAVWAYNPRLREAANVLLSNITELKKPEETRSEFQLGMSVAKARTVLWPFAPYKGQAMGSLVEAKHLGLKDLGYAVENAWDEKVRQAAITLSLVRLEQAVKEPAPSAGFVRIVSGGRSYAERQQFRLTMFQGLFLGVVIGVSFVVAIVTFLNPITSTKPKGPSFKDFVSTPEGVLAFIIAVVVILSINWLANFLPELITKEIDKKIAQYRRGQEGENKTVELLLQSLDGNWTIFRNLVLPDRSKADLDLVLVGPPGVWVLEVKNFFGEYQNIGDRWEYKNAKNWKKASSNPSQQARKNAAHLGNFLKADHINIFVNAAVVWANGESSLKVENPTVAVWLINRLADEIGNIWQGEKINVDEREKINEKLSKLCLKEQD